MKVISKTDFQFQKLDFDNRFTQSNLSKIRPSKFSLGKYDNMEIVIKF